MFSDIKSGCITITKLFTTIDRRIASFKRRTGLQCPPGCGHCCTYPDIEATIQEFIPLSMALWENGTAEDVLQRLETSPDTLCVFYDGEDGPLSPAGRCTVYPLRGILCRLFGFSFRRDKIGQLEILTCKPLRSQYSALAVENRQKELLIINQFIAQLESALPGIGNSRYPVNEAIQRAIEYVGFYRDLTNPVGRKTS